MNASLKILLLILISSGAFAQEQSEGSRNSVAKSEIKHKKPAGWYLPSAIRVGTDLRDLGTVIIGDGDYKGFEIDVDMDVLNRFFLVVNYGYEDRRISSTGNIYRYTKATNGVSVAPEVIANYNSNSRYSGYFTRLGFDYNFSPRNLDHSMIYGGLRYGFSSFDQTTVYHEEPSSSANSSPWGRSDSDITGKDYRLSWFEVVAGLKVNVYKNIYLTSALEIKFGKSIKGGDERLIPTKAPGYENLRGNADVGFSFGIAYRIPFREAYIPPAKPKK